MRSYLKCFLIFLIFSISCNDEQPTNPTSDLFGLYESSRFVEPGSTDGGIDIQSVGGYLRLTLNDNYTFNSELFIPENTESNYPEGKTTYKGKFSVSNEILEFESTGFIVQKLEWDESTRQLLTMEVPQRGQPFEIILYKYLR